MRSGTPLLSVVVPTHQRARYLPRAIESALRAAPDGDVEVVVVPNGLDRSWEPVAEKFKTDCRVQWFPIESAHANAARNHGIGVSRGKYLRFLDDDDYFLAAAVQQIRLLQDSGAEVCSGRVENVDDEGIAHGLLSFPVATDFVCAAVSFTGFAIPTSHVFLRQALLGCRWDEGLQRRQDYDWLLSLAGHREWNWTHLEEAVGVWFQHRGARVSSDDFMRAKKQPIIEKILVLHQKLVRENRMDDRRSAAIATALWEHVHRGFPHHPVYWTGVARRASEICSTARPSSLAFESGLLRNVNPLLAEWVLAPVRVAKRGLGRIAGRAPSGGHLRRL